MTMHPKIASIQMTSCGSIARNLECAGNLLAQAAQQGASVAVLPEMFPTLSVENGHIENREPYGHGPIQEFLAKSAQKNNLWIVGGTIPIACNDDQKVYGACLIYNNDGNCVARYDKIHLFDAKVKPGKEEYCESQRTLAGNTPIVIDSPVGKLGIAVCYDLRFPELFRYMAQLGTEVFVLPAAFLNTTGIAHWEVLLRARAIENLAYVVGANQTGMHHNGRQSFGHSMIIDPWGEILQQIDENIGAISAEIDLNYLHKIRQNLPVCEHRRLTVSSCESCII
jgi:predicted amidohydrolase